MALQQGRAAIFCLLKKIKFDWETIILTLLTKLRHTNLYSLREKAALMQVKSKER